MSPHLVLAHVASISSLWCLWRALGLCSANCDGQISKHQHLWLPPGVMVRESKALQCCLVSVAMASV